MSTEENKRIVTQFHNAMAAGDVEGTLSWLAPGAIWWVISNQPGGTTATKETIAPALAVYSKMYQQEPQYELLSLTAEDDRVALEKSARGGLTHGGARYDNDYFMLFRLRDGKIVEIREYMSPALVEPIMAEYSPGTA